jgi:phosphohistidine phosphatase
MASEKANKFILIMRHAKSDPAMGAQNDFHRTLSLHGKNQPRKIANNLRAMDLKIDMALVSPAKRTAETFDLLRENLDPEIECVFDDQLYNASSTDMLAVLRRYCANRDCILVVAHCPAVIEVTKFLSNELHNFKAADLAILKTTAKDLCSGLSKGGEFSLTTVFSADE